MKEYFERQIEMILFVMNGFDEGNFIDLEGKSLQVGRTDTSTRDNIKNDIILRHDAMMSGVHARFVIQEDGIFIEDLQSTHGTYLNHSRIKTPAMIGPGDVISMGSTLLLVCEDKTHLPKIKTVVRAIPH